ncbi:BOI-related E3 ubiquitin-protein ligase 1-like [Cynara cardunculus var. scolymus]|uniref:BOI-related E3 ubiquitin-protein ligase 1-like n=1 Tax=Cynara cardunculus var. scolymus TaxID=59895 RepID=UPI000D62C369|nr:BOI-related E3 ubiquitin-protein ligase 1-like [Cynara cardunculus var. scolymus]
MAVQAECSSNVLLLNRTIQEGKIQIGNKYSLPPQPGGGVGGGGGGGGGLATTLLDHQSINHTLFNNFPVGNCSTNQRKRGREDMMNQFMSNLHPQQSHCNQFMDVSQIQSRNVDVSTGLRLAFGDHHQQHSISPQSSGFASLLPEDLSNLMNQQGDEIEHYLRVQGEELRRKLAEKKQRHYSALIGAAKESASRMIRDKEVEAERAIRRNAELEARASQLSAEAQVWQAKARAQEAVAAALQAQLQQAIISGVGGCVSQGEEVGGGCAAGDAAEDAESSYIDPDRVVMVSGPGCKACGKRVASVVLLPCRHLCVCTECDDVVQACPLCLSLRSSSIEVYMS